MHRSLLNARNALNTTKSNWGSLNEVITSKSIQYIFFYTFHTINRFESCIVGRLNWSTRLISLIVRPFPLSPRSILAAKRVLFNIKYIAFFPRGCKKLHPVAAGFALEPLGDQAGWGMLPIETVHCTRNRDYN